MNEDNAAHRVGNEAGPEVVTTTQARQGVTGHNVRYVLVFGITGVIIVFALGYLAARGLFGA